MIDAHLETLAADRSRDDLALASQSPDAAAPALIAPLAALLDPAYLNRGETVILALKPSLWFIPLSAGPILTMIALALAVLLHVAATIAHRRFAIEMAVVAAGIRITWSILVWMGRWYLLTDLRIIRFGGVFTIDIVSCPLRKIAEVKLIPTTGEKLAGVGSIEITPRDPANPPAHWQTIARPRKVQKEILAAITRATQSGCAS